MAPPSPAMHRTILVVDVAGFGPRTNQQQVAVRDGLYASLERTFADVGVPWHECYQEDRGDGVLVLIPPVFAKSLFVEAFPSTLVDALRRHNARSPAGEQIRLRMALHAGEVHDDEHGVVGKAVNLTFRLLDAPVLKKALAESPGLLAIVTSAWFFDEVVWHSETADPGAYGRVRVVAKEIDTVAWIRLPDAHVPPTLGEPPARVGQVPQQLPMQMRQFVGRDREIAEVTGLLGGGGTVVITAIDGTAGVGKTSLAIHCAHEVADRFPDGQLHVNLRGFDPREPMDPDQALSCFLQALDVEPSGFPTDLEAKAALYRSRIADRRMLVVLDNARDTSQVRPLLPGSPTCAVIITSRNRLDSLTVHEGAYRIALEALSDEESLALLAERVPSDRLAAEPSAVRELLELCDRLPLALSIAGARAAGQPDLTISGLVARLRDERGRLDVLDLGDTDLSVRAVFSWSYGVLSPEAAQLFRLLGVHPGPDIDVFACRALTDRPERVLDELTAAHLLTQYVMGRYRFHDLLRIYAADLAADEPEAAVAGERMLDYYLRAALLANQYIQVDCAEQIQLVPSDMTLPEMRSYASAMAWFTAEQATLPAMITFAAERGFSTRAWQLALACTTFLRRTGRWHERASVHRTALTATQATGESTGQVTALRHLANAVARLGCPDEALEYLREADRVLQACPDQIGQFRNHLAYSRVLEAQERPTDALAHAEMAWELVRRSEHPMRHGDALTTMGHQLSRLSRFAEAFPLLTRALELYSDLQHTEGQADVLLTIGDIHRGLGDSASAVEHYQRSIDLDRQLGDRYWEAIGLERTGDLHRDLGDHARAEKYFRESLAILQDLRHVDEKRLRAKVMSD
ncbi:ATP-binding protein [Actinocrispum wychmicini]|uniref:Putative ATPase n=1 Tax=Actinocrispum wychmicini TaxID=1213861 RepID=A0A4R2JTP2_9PSEU|nr:tetratricopeptide repeat protein [Actinocrispum wychmicini]TCO62537.1 putative ATPase [Actinocrispum wychmicini]